MRELQYIVIKLSNAISLIFVLIICTNCYAFDRNPEFSIITDRTPGTIVTYGLIKLMHVLDNKNIAFEKVESINEAQGNLIIVAGLAYGDGIASEMLKTGNKNIPKVSEALIIWKTNWEKKHVWVISGFDDRGLMYGLLDVSDRINWSTSRKLPMREVAEIIEKPDVQERTVVKYTMQRTNFENQLFDENYWIEYFDLLAKNRINGFVMHFGYETDGFLAPVFPYFFDVDGYPGVYMENLTTQEQKRNLSAVKRVIELAHQRGIRFLMGGWDHVPPVSRGSRTGNVEQPNTSVDPQTKGPQTGKVMVYGINQENLIPYTKAATKKLLEVFPEIDGLQIRMHYETGLRTDQMGSFWHEIFKVIKETAPKTNINIVDDFIIDLRAKALPLSIINDAIIQGLAVRISTKYWMEQMGMPWHPTHINRQNQMDQRHGYADMLYYPQEYKMHWQLWSGGTTRILLWGNPEFARRFAESTHLYNKEGSFEVIEPLATKMHGQPHDAKPFDLLNSQYVYYNYEFERYWHFFQVFGRIGYNPNQSPDIWQKEFEIRFGKKAGPVVEKAIHEASWILPRIVASCYPYSCFPTTRGWPEKQRLGDLPGYASAEGSDIQQFANFDEEAQILIEGEESAKLLPSMTSLWFEQTSNSINNLVLHAEKVVGKNRNKEFNSTITDLKILSNLALYHSRRIPAAVSYRIFVRTKDVSALDKAIEYEKNAIEAWKQIVESAGNIYAENLMMGLQEAEFQGLTHRLTGHWKDELRYLEEGLKELEQQRLNFKPEGIVKNAPQYKVAVNADNSNFFQVSLQKVTGAPAGKPITVKVRVAVTSGIKWVRLRYRSVNQKEEYKTLEMKKNGDSFETTVPAEQIDPKYDFMYFIEVMDNSGNGKIYPDLNKETPYIIVKLIR